MVRFRDAALVASLFGALPALAGTSIANSEGMDTPALSLVSAAASGETPSAPAASGAVGLFEALIADFRWGDPEMGAVPHLPVPPPYRMRAEEGAEGGDEVPPGGNSGNPLPLHPLHLPLPPPTEFVKLPEVPPTPPPVVMSRHTATDLIAGTAATMGLVSEPQTTLTGAADLPRASPTVVPAGNVSTNVSMPAADTDRAVLDALVRQLTPNESVARDVALADTNGARHREPAVATPTDTARVADRPAPPATPANAVSTPTPPALASAIERAVNAAAATTRSRDTARDARSEVRSSRATLDTVTNSPTERVPSRPGANEAARILERGPTHESRLERPTHDVLPEVSFERAAPSQPDQSFAVAVSTPSAAQTSSVATRLDAPVLHLDTPVTQPEWADGIGERIVWLSDNRVNDAQIRLNPAHLGPVEVRVSVGEDQTSVSFIAHHAATREALESATPRLREMLSAHGFGTVNVNISHQSSGERTAQHPQSHAWNAHELPASDEYARDAGTRHARPSSKTLDAYA